MALSTFVGAVLPLYGNFATASFLRSVLREIFVQHSQAFCEQTELKHVHSF